MASSEETLGLQKEPNGQQWANGRNEQHHFEPQGGDLFGGLFESHG